MVNISENPLMLMMILLIVGLVYIVGIAFFTLIIVWVKGYCNRIYEMPEH